LGDGALCQKNQAKRHAVSVRHLDAFRGGITEFAPNSSLYQL
jgi:hypothetical protein